MSRKDPKVPTKQEELRSLIDSAVQPGQDNYTTDSARWLYAYGLVRELLVYSASNQIEVWQHLRKLSNRQDDNNDSEPST